MQKSHSSKKLDLTGERYGKLTVIAPTENIDGRTAWLCQCDCGNEHIVKTKFLRNGHVTSCGCAGPFSAEGRHTNPERVVLGMLHSDTVRRNNTSGVPGVEWVRSKGLWRASICFHGKRRYLGYYALFGDAVAARRGAELELRSAYENGSRQRLAHGEEQGARVRQGHAPAERDDDRRIPGDADGKRAAP